ncbi:hypothetical protein K456DRAFT_36053 [Colletotrichum gloeosporioides 23]|nr:hypothetical protein K456DRAFT_36053 [Colletotrichum gloeosporioides 23]
MSPSSLAHNFCLRLIESLLGSCSGVVPFPQHISRSTLKADYAHGPAVFVHSAVTCSLTWETESSTDDDTQDESEADETDSIMSQFDHASDEDFDPGYVSEDSPSDASDSPTCIDMLSDLGEYEDEDDEAADGADGEEDDEEDDLEPTHAHCFKKRYEKVRVMSMIWDVSGLCSTKYPHTVDEEMEDPMESFEDYWYEVEKFIIPSTLPTRRL